MNPDIKLLKPVHLVRRHFLENFVWSQKEYTPYVIISHARSGSTFFKSLLNSHPGITCYGELFNIVPKKRFFNPIHFPFLPSESAEYLEKQRRENTIPYMDKYIFRKYSKSIHAVGFKIFYYHAKEGHWNCIWDYLENRKDIKVIHLVRNNLLKTYLSLELARKHNTWHGKIPNQEPIRLEISECEKYFEDISNHQKQVDKKYANRELLNISYEELSRNREDIMAKAFNFLGQNPVSTKTTYKKRSKWPLSESIENYTELKAHFTNSPWAKYFEE